MKKGLFSMVMGAGLALLMSGAQAQYGVQVGYADGLRGSTAFFPVPWVGDAGVVDPGGAAGQAFDAGAIRIINNGGSSIHVDHVLVDGFSSGPTYNLWGSFDIPVGMSAVLTQTNQYNFDTSDFGISGCTNDGAIPKVHVTVGSGPFVTSDFSDTAQILNTHGVDVATCPFNGSTDESFAWRDVGTTGDRAGVPEPGSIAFLSAGLVAIPFLRRKLSLR